MPKQRLMQLSVDGVQFDISDSGTGAAIVLLHGFPLAKETWDAQAGALATSHRVVRMDLRGLGKSSVPPGPYLMETLAGDLAGVLDALRIERATIVGHSLGGYVAFAFWRMFAERCAGLGFVCSRASADDDAAADARRALADRVETEGIAVAADAFIPRYFAPEVYASAPELPARAREIALATAPAGAAAMLRGMAERVPSDDLFAEIDVPVRVIAGARDQFFPVTDPQKIAGAVRGAKIDVLECGHFAMWEAPEQTNAILAELAEAAAQRG